MHRPFTILCLSDLHCDSSDDLRMNLTNISNGLSKYSSNPEMNPDFIVFSGDIFNEGNIQDVDKYAAVIKEFAQKLLRFATDDSNKRIIFSMGNHDYSLNNRDVNVKPLNAFTKGFEDCKTIQIKLFDDYVALCNKFYKNATYFSGIGDANAKGDEIIKQRKFLNGLRIFEEEKVCFWSINTELVSYSEKRNKDWVQKVKRGVKEREKEGFLLPKKIIQSEINRIENGKSSLDNTSYLDFTIVTVMHRALHDMCWKQKQDENIYDKIVSLSDIIISGHDHTTYMREPSYIHNNVQSFEIGQLHNMPVATASLLIVNPLRQKVKLSPLRYGKISGYKEFQWYKYPINDIEYPLMQKDKNMLSFLLDKSTDIPCVFSKSYWDDDIENAIKKLFNLTGESLDCAENTCLIHNYSNNFDFSTLNLSDSKKTRLIFYHTVDNEDFSDLVLPKNIYDMVIKQRLVIEHVMVVFPDVPRPTD